MVLTPISSCKVAGSQSCSRGDWQGKFMITLATFKEKGPDPQPLAQRASETKRTFTGVARREARLHASLHFC